MIKSHLLYQLSYVPERMKNIRNKGVPVNGPHNKKAGQRPAFLKFLVTKGVEPSTSAFGGQRSIQLSYVTVLDRARTMARALSALQVYGVDDGI
jgi:hypothetical protein